MKIAILQEMLVKLGGAEKVVEKILTIFPEADLFTLIYDENKVKSTFPKKKINSQVFNLSTQTIYKYTKNQRFCLPFMAKAVEKLDFSEYDIVIASSSGFAHGAITKPETKFIVYCHSPARYMWDWTNEYKKDLGLDSGWKKFLFNYPLNKLFLNLRQWDYIASKRSDIILANSTNTQNRILKYHKNNSEILYPPIELERFGKKIDFKNTYNEYYIIISMLSHYKKIQIAIGAFNKMPDKKLLIIGNGDYKSELENIAKDNINFLGAKYGNDLVGLLQNAKGLIFPGEEDFGMVPVEAMASGIPIFAYKAGGLLETNIEGLTGEFFNNNDGSDFIENFKIFNDNINNNIYKKENLIKQADKFSDNQFERRLKEIVYN